MRIGVIKRVDGRCTKNINFQIAIVKILSKFRQHTFMSILNIQIDIRYKFLNIHKNFQICKYLKNRLSIFWKLNKIVWETVVSQKMLVQIRN